MCSTPQRGAVPGTGMLNVLITNLTMASRTGTELYVRDLALALRRLGHRPAVYSHEPGELMEELRAAGIACATDIAAVEGEPDVIHGHHNYATLAALLRFPGAPAVLFCHDATGWHDEPLRHPRIYRYVAVSEATRARVLKAGMDPARTLIIPNFCDLARFVPRGPLPERPRRALALSNYICGAELEAVREGCARAGVELDVFGAAAGRPCRAPEEVLGAYDLVIGKGRVALEAMAVGCAVVLCDKEGAGYWVSPENFDSLRACNFGMFTFYGPVTAGDVAREIGRYSVAAAEAVTARVRAECGVDATARRLVNLYEEIRAEHRVAVARPVEEQQAAAPGVEWLTGSFRWALYHLGEARKQTAAAEAVGAGLREELQAARAQAQATQAALDETRQECARDVEERERARRELEQIHATLVWRLRQRIVRLPLVGRAAQTISRACARMAGLGR